MTIYIHIGIGKTGTTAIQDAFFQGEHWLAEKKWIYPKIGLIGNGHHALAPLETRNFSSDTKAAYENIRELQRSKPDWSILLSSESYSYIETDFVSSMAEVLHGVEVKIIFYVRQQAALIESVFLQWQKAGHDYGGCVKNFYEKHKDQFDFMRLIKPWADHFGAQSILARVYDRRVIGDDVLKDFLLLLGLICESDKIATCRANPSLLAEFSEIVAMYDSLSPNKEQREAFVKTLMDLSSRFRSLAHGSIVDESLRQEIEDYYSSTNRVFAETYLANDQARILLGEPGPQR